MLCYDFFSSCGFLVSNFMFILVFFKFCSFLFVVVVVVVVVVYLDVFLFFAQRKEERGVFNFPSFSTLLIHMIF